MIIDLVADENKIRIDKYLADRFKISRSEISDSIKEGSILVNSTKVKASYILSCGDIVKGVVLSKQMDLSPVDMDLDIIYEDDYLIVINKPYDLIVHPSLSTKEPTLVNGLIHYTDKLSDFAGEDRPGIVHRLDKDTTGIMLICKDNNIHKELSELFKSRKVKKTYLAVVNGTISNEGVINQPISRDLNNRTKMAVDEINGKESITEYRPIDYNEKYSLLELNLITGRTHQIRVHMSSINKPIVGDPVYGLKKEKIKVPHQLLHSYKLQFVHPITKEYMDLSAMPDGVFEEGLLKTKLNFHQKEEI